MTAAAASESFGRERRVRLRRDFQRIQKSRLRVSTEHFIFLAEALEAGEPARMGLVVSRRVGNAVARNRIKRRCREVFRKHLRDTQPMAIVVVAKTGAATLPLDEVAREWTKAIKSLERKLAP